jgi:RNA polymerase sigma-70 factor (ECF subfamily)
VTIPPKPELLDVTLPHPTPQPPADAAVVRRVLTGDVEAFSLLVDRHHARALRVATHLLGSPDDAEDVVQEAFLRAYRHLGSYREQERFGAWLVRIVVNQCRTRVAKESRYQPLDSLPADLDAVLPSAEETTEAALQRRLLAAALAKLPFEQREAIVLRFADALSYDDMAVVTGAGVSALKMRVQRACARLRALLAEQFS